MNHIYILEADPTRIGGIQQFVRNLAEYMPPDRTSLLAYYGDLSYDKQPVCNIHNLNDRLHTSWIGRLFGNSKRELYLSKSDIIRYFALLCDLMHIRKNLKKLLTGGDTLILNSASAMLLFCSKQILQNNRIILVQHNAPHILRTRNFDFGGVFRKQKIVLFKKYIDCFVLLSPYEKAHFDQWLPLSSKKCVVIRHACCFPESLSDVFPNAIAVVARIVKLKRIDRVIDVARLLPEIKFNIYGYGPDEDYFKRLAKGIKNIAFHGYTNNIGDVYRENQALLITSDYEGYSISGIEACVYGRPVIVLNTYPAAKDLVEDRVNGRVLDDFSPEALATAILEVMSLPEQYRCGALKHREQYNQAIICDKWRKLILAGEEK